MPATPLYHGVCYYPELWPAGDLERDIAEMQRLGINLVRMGEFAWSVIEPNEGEISLEYFKGVLDRLHAAGIAVVWCTPTPTPPIWLTHGHPERCFTDAAGVVMSHGSRQHASFENPDVRAACHRIVEACGAELGRHPAIVGWQIDNEFKCHVAEDFNPHAIAAWHGWLAERYGSIDELNAAWGTDVWSETYQRFDQVPAPVSTPFLHHASLSTAWRMFARERVAAFMDEQAAILRRHTEQPITHNFGVGFAVNLERMSTGLDFVSFDDYPSAANWSDGVFDHDLFRAAKPNRAHWVMETSVAHNGWFGAHETSHPKGFLAAEAVVSFALGARTMCYWLWRQQRGGCEMPHSAVMSAWFKPSIGHAEVQAVESARRALEPLLANSCPAPAEVALTWSDRGRVMLDVEPLGADRERHAVDYLATLKAWHRRLCDAGLPRDVRFEGAALDGLKVLFTPAMACVDEVFLDRVEAWVRAGGTWVCGPLTGTRTAEHNVPTDAGLGARLERLAGVEMVYAWPLTGSGTKGIVDSAREIPLAGWGMALRPSSEATRVRGVLRSDSPAEGLAWWTERDWGAGRIVMLTAEPEGDVGGKWLHEFVRSCAAEAGVASWGQPSPGTLIAPQCDANGESWWIAINCDGQGGTVVVPDGLTDAITGEAVAAGTLTVGRYAWRALKR
ncbi:beta-galactosidase [Synoicihabitans lomoniglobus]|uniref:Beta-galactosidase n=1 Tax=Synoicihabitans lomoniglobus TaxID=2909285 RepID=A0AAE9ZS29_9BACT|nr:beta-galactosidase [Opitutaceae bacterium LMO-M01]WED64200.1 beta-galactosidase [Opitutaceae bacterium LMO-M01]